MKKLFYLVALPLAFIACKKDEKVINATPIPSQVINAVPLAVGNYWVYDTYKVDTNGVETYFRHDSLYVTGKQVLNGDTFYSIKGSDVFTFGGGGGIPALLRDSAGYIVSSEHQIYYAPNNDTLYTYIGDSNDYIDRVDTYMTYIDSTRTVPAGTFSNTATLLTVNIRKVGLWHYWGTRRDSYYVFADNVGLINRQYCYSGPPEYFEMRLVRYHVN